MATRVPSSERTSQKIRELIQELEEGDGLEGLLQLAMRKIIEEALEAEVSDVLGRGHYARRREGQKGYRNGSRPARVKSAEGPIEYRAPQVSDTDEPFRSGIRPELEKRTRALEELAVEMYARGLSTRDIEATFRGEDGRSLLSRTAVSEVTEQLWEEYEAFATRDLSEFKLLYLFVDGVAERLHTGQRREMVLCAWGITDEGEKVLLHLSPGTKEDTASCTAFFQDLKRRGLEDPLLVVTDGAPGLIRAVEECFPPGGATTLFGPSDAQPRLQDLRARLAGVSRPRQGLLRGTLARGRSSPARRPGPTLREDVTHGRAVLHG